MALKDLVINKPKRRKKSAREVVITVLKGHGVSAPKSTADAILAALHSYLTR